MSMLVIEFGLEIGMALQLLLMSFRFGKRHAPRCGGNDESPLLVQKVADGHEPDSSYW